MLPLKCCLFQYGACCQVRLIAVSMKCAAHFVRMSNTFFHLADLTQRMSNSKSKYGYHMIKDRSDIEIFTSLPLSFIDFEENTSSSSTFLLLEDHSASKPVLATVHTMIYSE